MPWTVKTMYDHNLSYLMHKQMATQHWATPTEFMQLEGKQKKRWHSFCVLVFIGAQENWVRIEFALEIAYEVECCGKQVTAPTSKMQDSKSCASSFDTSVASPAYSRCPTAGGSRANSRSHVKMLRISCGCGFLRKSPYLTLVILHAFKWDIPTLGIWHCCCVARDIYHAHDSGFSNGNPIESVVPMGRRHAPKRSPNQAPAEYREASHTKDWPSFLSPTV